MPMTLMKMLPPRQGASERKKGTIKKGFLNIAGPDPTYIPSKTRYAKTKKPIPVGITDTTYEPLLFT